MTYAALCEWKDEDELAKLDERLAAPLDGSGRSKSTGLAELMGIVAAQRKSA